jgi:predicted RNA-binding protein (virulence factor B family)
VVEAVDLGFLVDAENLGDVLLPRKHAPHDLEVHETLEVFLYLNSDAQPAATTQRPLAEVGDFAYLNVVDTNVVGAFLDWGLDKDLLVPFSEQHRPMVVGKSYLVHLYLNRGDGRITASSKIDKFLGDAKAHSFEVGEAVDLIIGNSTELGYKAIINQTHYGLLFKNEVYERISFGQSIGGFIKELRPDGKINLSLQEVGFHGRQVQRDRYSDLILEYLDNHEGFAPVHDKSAPKVIADLFSMSKGAFKKTIGGLYKARLITIDKEGIRLIKEDSP